MYSSFRPNGQWQGAAPSSLAKNRLWPEIRPGQGSAVVWNSPRPRHRRGQETAIVRSHGTEMGLEATAFAHDRLTNWILWPLRPLEAAHAHPRSLTNCDPRPSKAAHRYPSGPRVPRSHARQQESAGHQVPGRPAFLQGYVVRPRVRPPYGHPPVARATVSGAGACPVAFTPRSSP